MFSNRLRLKFLGVDRHILNWRSTGYPLGPSLKFVWLCDVDTYYIVDQFNRHESKISIEIVVVRL
jgi:hypothetical protein